MPSQFSITYLVRFRPWARGCLWLGGKMVNAGLRLIEFATDNGVELREARK
jgi:hypothetical protein